MASKAVGVGVIGGGKAGRAHSAALRNAVTLYGGTWPAARMVAISTRDPERGERLRRQFGYERAESDWRALAEDPEVDAVAVAVTPIAQREIAEALMAAGKHVLCEKPLATTRSDAAALVVAADRVSTVAAVGFSYRRSPAVEAIRRHVASGRLGEVLYFQGRYWAGYAADWEAPVDWHFRGPVPSGALADIGSHLVDLAEYICGPLSTVAGGITRTFDPLRTHASAAADAPAGVAGRQRLSLVENEDLAVFTGTFASGAVGEFSVSRVAHGSPNGLGFEVFGSSGRASFNLHRASEFCLVDGRSGAGIQTVVIGPEHPYVRGGLAMDITGAGHGMGDLFTYQARSFLDETEDIHRLPGCATFAEGARNVDVLACVADSAASDGAPVAIRSPGA